MGALVVTVCAGEAGLPSFDKAITLFFNSFAQRWWTLDKVINFLQANQVVEGTFAVAVLYYVWFEIKGEVSRAELDKRRQSLLFALLICIPAVLVARVMAYILPYRTRPIYNSALHLRLAYAFDPTILLRWSSFPSDHAVLFFTLATGVFLVSRRPGLVLYAHAIVVVCLTRIYLGVHYPSDIVVGGLLGYGFASLVKWEGLRSLVTRPGVRLLESSPGLFHACLFCLAFETACMYNDVRTSAIGALQIVRVLLHR